MSTAASARPHHDRRTPTTTNRRAAADPAAARTAVINAVNAIALSATPTAQQKTDRARMATYLVAASNHYQIQR